MSLPFLASLLGLLITSPAPQSAPVCLVSPVSGDATQTLQTAIDHCAGQGGTVRLAPGRYLTRPLFLKSNETFEVEAGATLLGSTDPQAYRNGDSEWALLNASHVTHLSLTGAGTIDGQGQSWWSAVRQAQQQHQDEPTRPRLIVLSHVQDVHISGLTLQNSPSFHLVPSYAQQVTVDGVTIRAPADSPNTDGIDPSDTRDMTITHTTIDVGDDNIAIKAGQTDPTHPGAASGDITVEHCHFLHGHGLSVGSETVGGVQGVKVDDVQFDGTTTAIRVKTLRGKGGPVHDLSFSHLTLHGVRDAISLASYYPKVPAHDTAQPIGPTTPDLANISFDSVTGDATRSLGTVVGLPEQPIKQVSFQNMTLQAPQGLEIRDATLNLSATTFKVTKGQDLLAGQGAVINRQ